MRSQHELKEKIDAWTANFVSSMGREPKKKDRKNDPVVKKTYEDFAKVIIKVEHSYMSYFGSQFLCLYLPLAIL